MDEFIRSLSLSANTNLSDVTESCAKILTRLEITANMSVTYNDIELFLKAAFFIDECIHLFGKGNLKKSLIEHYPFYESYFEMIFINKLNDRMSCVEFLCTKILQTENGHRHIFFLDKLLKTLKELTISTSNNNNNNNNNKNTIIAITDCIYSIANVETRLYPKEREQMLNIVQRIFQLPVKEIDEAIGRALNFLPFDIIGYIFIESKSSSFYDKCVIMVHKICNCLINEESDVTLVYFLHTMYKTAAIDADGLEFHWKCLRNKIFGDALSEMLVLYLKTLNEVDDQLKFETKHKIYKNYNFDNVLYLVYCCTVNESPIRRMFYRKMHNATLSKNLLKIINELKFVFQ